MRLLTDQQRTRNATSTISAVFNTTELLEEVLVRIDMKSLLLAQRVSRKWQAVISTSPFLQKKLFMVPVTDTKEAFDLGMLEPRLFRVPRRCLYPAYLGLDTNAQNFMIPNPMLDYTFCFGRIRLDVQSLRGNRMQRFENKARSTVRKLQGKPDVVQSWTRMLGTQPPQGTTTIYHDYALPEASRVAFFEHHEPVRPLWSQYKRRKVTVDAWQISRHQSPPLGCDRSVAGD